MRGGVPKVGVFEGVNELLVRDEKNTVALLWARNIDQESERGLS